MFGTRKIAKDDVWTGTVTAKSRNMPDGSNMYHYVEVAVEGDGTRKFRIDKALWESLEAGDGITKAAGADAVKR